MQSTNIFSELLQRKSKPKNIEFEFLSVKQAEQIPTSPKSHTPFSTIAYQSPFHTFNVREHYRKLKQQARSRHNLPPAQEDSFLKLQKQIHDIRESLSRDTRPNNQTEFKLAKMTPTKPELRTEPKQQSKSSKLLEGLETSSSLKRFKWKESTDHAFQAVKRSKALSPESSRLRFLELDIKGIGE